MTLELETQHEDEPGKGSFKLRVVKIESVKEEQKPPFDNRVPSLGPNDTQSYLETRIKTGDLATAVRPDGSDACLLMLNPGIKHLITSRSIILNGNWLRLRSPQNSLNVSFTPIDLNTHEKIVIKGVVIENNERKPVNIELTFIPGTQT